MPNNILRKCRVGVQMYEILSNSDTVYSHSQGSSYNLAPCRIGIAYYVGGIPASVSTVSAPAFGLVPSDRAVSAREFQRDASKRTHRVKGCHKTLLHILQRAGGHAGPKLCLFEIPCSYHLWRLLVVFSGGLPGRWIIAARAPIL